MLAALIIVFREVFEAGLIIGIVMAATSSVAHRGLWTAAGIGGGVLGACLVALSIRQISALFDGMGQELLNATILAIAVIMLTWHNVWMARHGREMAQEMRSAGDAVVAGSRTMAALAVVIGVAVLREGAEVVLFLYGIAIDGTSGFTLVVGGAIGLALGALVSVLTYGGLIAIPPRHLFAVTSALIAFLAAGMAAQSIAFLEQANVTRILDQIVWDSSTILDDRSMLGRTLHTLIGYSDRPTALQLLVYLAILSVTFGLMKLTATPTRRPFPAE